MSKSVFTSTAGAHMPAVAFKIVTTSSSKVAEKCAAASMAFLVARATCAAVSPDANATSIPVRLATDGSPPPVSMLYQT